MMIIIDFSLPYSHSDYLFGSFFFFFAIFNLTFTACLAVFNISIVTVNVNIATINVCKVIVVLVIAIRLEIKKRNNIHYPANMHK